MGIDIAVAYLLLGAFVGLFAGLLGIGGGGIMVPVLVTLFLWQHFPQDQVIHLALGSSMAAIVPTALVSMLAQQKKGAIMWPVVRYLVPGVVIATFTMAFWVAEVSSQLLATVFFCFMSFIAYKLWFDRSLSCQRKLPSRSKLILVGGGIGGMSAWVSIGGGSLTVPFLLRYGVSIRQAIASSAAVGFPLSLAGALGYIMSGLKYDSQIPYTLGYVYVPAVIAITLMSVITAPLGVILSHLLPVKILKRVFAVLLSLLSFKMLLTVL